MIEFMVFMTVLALVTLCTLWAAWLIQLDNEAKDAEVRKYGRWASYYTSSSFSQAAAEFAEGRIFRPGIIELVKMRPGQVQQLLGLQEKGYPRKLIDAIVRVLQEEFKPMSIYVSGSFKKGTALKQRSDVDLVMQVLNFHSRDLHQLAHKAWDVLRQAFGGNIELIRSPERPFHVLSYVVGGGLAFDLVITGDPQNKTCDDAFYSAATAHVADEAIIEFAERRILFRPLALLCKHWAYEFETTYADSKRPKSYFIELFAMEAIRQVEDDAVLSAAFSLFLELISSGDTQVTNLNPNGKPKRISLHDAKWQCFREYARNTALQMLINGVGTALTWTSSCGAVSDAGSDSMEDYNLPGNDALVPNESTRAQYSIPSNIQAYLLNAPLEDRYFWEGDHRYVAKGKYVEGDRAGCACVAKWFKAGDVYEADFFSKDLQAVEKAGAIASAFNHVQKALSPFCPPLVRVNSPGVWTEEPSGKKKMVEPFLRDFKKFNSNTAMSSDEDGFPLMQALSHFSYHISDGQCLLCDVQGAPPQGVLNGVMWSATYTLTDPVICSPNRNFGPTDLGQKGIENFFYYHKCNMYCRASWKKTKGYPHFQRSWGSLMIG